MFVGFYVGIVLVSSVSEFTLSSRLTLGERESREDTITLALDFKVCVRLHVRVLSGRRCCQFSLWVRWVS